VAVWEPFIQDTQGRTVAYRTFVQPDADRPYALTGIVAFDLDHIRLHFVLGFADPYAQGHKEKRHWKNPCPGFGAREAVGCL